MLTREQRLTTRQFQRVYELGSSHVGRLVVLRVLANSAGSTRWGIAVGKKLVRRSPDRARLRRRLRCVVYDMTELEADCVVTVRDAGTRSPLRDLRTEISSLVDRARASVRSR